MSLMQTSNFLRFYVCQYIYRRTYVCQMGLFVSTRRKEKKHFGTIKNKILWEWSGEQAEEDGTTGFDSFKRIRGFVFVFVSLIVTACIKTVAWLTFDADKTYCIQFKFFSFEVQHKQRTYTYTMNTKTTTATKIKIWLGNIWIFYKKNREPMFDERKKERLKATKQKTRYKNARWRQL